MTADRESARARAREIRRSGAYTSDREVSADNLPEVIAEPAQGAVARRDCDDDIRYR